MFCASVSSVMGLNAELTTPLSAMNAYHGPAIAKALKVRAPAASHARRAVRFVSSRLTRRAASNTAPSLLVQGMSPAAIAPISNMPLGPPFSHL